MASSSSSSAVGGQWNYIIEEVRGRQQRWSDWGRGWRWLEDSGNSVQELLVACREVV
jgi:hypothetical protein